MIRTILLALAALFTCLAAPASAERVRDLGTFQAVRSNQLTGYGIVVGLDGTGDDNFAYVTQAMRGVSDRFGLRTHVVTRVQATYEVVRIRNDRPLTENIRAASVGCRPF